MPLHVSSGPKALGFLGGTRHPADVRRQIKTFPRAAHEEVEFLILGEDSAPRIHGPVDEGSLGDREEGHRDDAIPAEVHECHERESDLPQAQVEVADESLQLVSGHLCSGGVVTLEQSTRIHRELKQDAMHNVLGPASQPAQLDGLDGLLVEAKVHLRDDDLAICVCSIDEVLPQMHQLLRRLNLLHQHRREGRERGERGGEGRGGGGGGGGERGRGRGSGWGVCVPVLEGLGGGESRLESQVPIKLLARERGRMRRGHFAASVLLTPLFPMKAVGTRDIHTSPSPSPSPSFFSPERWTGVE